MSRAPDERHTASCQSAPSCCPKPSKSDAGSASRTAREALLFVINRANPEHWAIWAKDDLTSEQTAEFIRVNSQISLHQINFELGLVTLSELRVRAGSVMERAAVRRFWSTTRELRATEAQDASTIAFMEVFDREHDAAAVLASEKAENASV
ncbi:DUF6082 family protein [Streptomyces sp. NPDC058486]|uniref:DUF6082 family protein n=1 Tax=unclassified Streptomyces TaxID=2593676 RepID=UPI003649110A